MIRKCQTEDIKQVLRIWLESNIEAHNFIKQEYWLTNVTNVKKQLEFAEVYVYEQECKVVGFLGMQGNYLAGIFINKDNRCNGIGKQLLDFIKDSHQEIILKVYKENKDAIKFYEREGFHFISEEMDNVTNNVEWLMQWKVDNFME